MSPCHLRLRIQHLPRFKTEARRSWKRSEGVARQGAVRQGPVLLPTRWVSPRQGHAESHARSGGWSQPGGLVEEGVLDLESRSSSSLNPVGCVSVSLSVPFFICKRRRFKYINRRPYASDLWWLWGLPGKPERQHPRRTSKKSRGGAQTHLWVIVFS